MKALSISKDWAGQHVFKVGVDYQHSSFDGISFSQQLDIVRLDGSLAERTTYSPSTTTPEVIAYEFSGFVQDRWRVNDRLMLELGFRADRDDVVERVNYSPRAGLAVSILPDGRGILRGGIGKFAERTPLTVGAFTQYEGQTVSRFAANGAALAGPVTLTHVIDGELRTPESIVQTAAWDQRFGRQFFFKAAYLHRTGSHAYVLDPDRRRSVLALSSTGESRYWEFETTGRYLASEHRDLTVSYVRSHSTRNLNDFDQFYGNFRNPIIRANENGLSPTDVPNRIDRARHAWPDGQVGADTGLRVEDRLPVVGGRRIPGFRRAAERSWTAADGLHARLHPGAAPAIQEVSLYRWSQGLQPVRYR